MTDSTTYSSIVSIKIKKPYVKRTKRKFINYTNIFIPADACLKPKPLPLFCLF